jgi:CHAT domain-containing protein
MVSPSPMPLPDLRELTQVTPERFHPIAAFYQPDGCTVHHGRDATWPAFRHDAADADVLLFATHAEALDAPGADPMNSYIALAPAPGHDGLLRARDLLGMDLGAQVAILSACRTGAGQLTGDGLIGLSRAFLTAGPSTLLMTLYETGELTSLDLMYRFHAHWKGGGVTAAAALRRAQCELHQESRGRQPHLWAPFVLFGLDTTPEEA